MAFVVEDGTGLSTATSLVAVATADAYWTDRGGNSNWPTDAAVKQQRLILASDYIRNQRRYRWSGRKLQYTQRMPFPREGAVERDGNAVPNNIVPWQASEAVCYLAGRADLADIQPDLERGGEVLSERVGPLSTTFAPHAPFYTVLQVVDGLLAPLLRLARDPVAPYTASADTPPGFVAGEFGNAGA